MVLTAVLVAGPLAAQIGAERTAAGPGVMRTLVKLLDFVGFGAGSRGQERVSPAPAQARAAKADARGAQQEQEREPPPTRLGPEIILGG